MNLIEKYFGSLGLSQKQSRFLENLHGDYLELGQEAALAAANQPALLEKATISLNSVINDVESNKEKLELLALGNWEGIVHLDLIVEELIDEEFDKSLKAVPAGSLSLYGFAEYPDLVEAFVRDCHYTGLWSVLEGWVRRLLMQLSENKLSLSGTTSYASLSEQQIRSRIDSLPQEESFRGLSEDEMSTIYLKTFEDGSRTISKDLFHSGSLPKRDLEDRLSKYYGDEDFLEKLSNGDDEYLTEVLSQNSDEEEFVYTMVEKYFSNYPLDAKRMTNWEVAVFYEGMEEQIEGLAKKAIQNWAKNQN